MSSGEKVPSDTSKERIATVAVPRRLDKVLHYSIPDRLLGKLYPGMRLLVPLGRSKITGYLVGFSEDNGSVGLKEIIDILDDTPIVNNEILDLSRWASEYFMQPLGLMIKAAIPGGADLKSRQYFRLIDHGISEPANPDSIKGRVVSVLKNKSDWVSISELSKEIDAEIKGARLPRILSRLRKNGILEEDIRIVGRRDSRTKKRRTTSDIKEPDNLPQLKGKELDLINEIKELINAGKYSPYLLVEMDKAARERIYSYLISICIEKGVCLLLLVPEISPNLGMIKRLEGIFRGRISLFHSQMSEGKRLDAFSRIREGKIDIVVGTRSAVFAPVDPLGMIIVEDEDDPSYRQESNVKYNAKTLALKRGERLNIPVILGSSAPSVEGFYYGMTGVYRLRALDNPSHNVAKIKIVDMQDTRGRYILSDHLKSSITDNIARNGKVFLFINKRGFSGSIVCQECGYYFRCSHCALAMTYHKGAKILLCRYCNKSVDAPGTCPQCGSHRLTEVGIGTERVEEDIRKILPGTRIIRLDRDTIKDKKEGLREGEIIIGTEMAVRRFDSHPFALIGIVSADTALHLPDFRLSHRIFKLLRRLIDLAGDGEVIIQTHNPSHHAIQAVIDPQNKGLDQFYLKEIGYRKELKYPPFSSMTQITIEGSNKDRCLEKSLRLCEIMRGSLGKGVELLGPAKGYPEMIKGKHRWQIIMKGNSPNQNIIKRSVEQLNNEGPTSGIRIDLDIDP